MMLYFNVAVFKVAYFTVVLIMSHYLLTLHFLVAHISVLFYQMQYFLYSSTCYVPFLDYLVMFTFL